MARKRKSSGLSAPAVAVVVVIGVISAMPKELLVAFGLIGIAAGVLYLWSKSSAKSSGAATTPKTSLPPSPVKPQPVAPLKRDTGPVPVPSRRTVDAKDSMVTVAIEVSNSRNPATSFRIPDPPAQGGKAEWTPANKSVTVAGVVIPGGLVYVGTSLPVDTRVNDPCLIDPSKPVASSGDYRQRQMDYWPSYSNISPTARRAYLNWLAGGRGDPEADIGFVFLFFYGLERRVLVDSKKDSIAKADWPAIKTELARLCTVYGNHPGSFLRYASSLLRWMTFSETSEKVYLREFQAFERSHELPFEIRLALGQAAADQVPVPATLALRWAKLHPETSLRTPAVRCCDQFDKLFVVHYKKAFGQGMVVPRNRTRLKLSHYPGSAAFQGKEQVAPLGDIPDVSVLTGPIKKLHSLVEETTGELEAYSRFIGKNPELRNALESLLLLPPVLWSDAAQHALRSLKDRMAEGILVISFQELLKTLEAKSTLTKEKVLALARALETLQIGMEPDVLNGSKLPRSDDKVALFTIPAGGATVRSTPAYQAAALTLQLASAVAYADGDFCAKELAYLQAQVESWTHLTPNQIRRLLAHLRLLHAVPASMTGLRSKIEPLDAASKESIAAFMAQVAQADGVVSPEEIKLLEKLYKSLGIESTRVFSDVHAAAAGPQAVATAPAAASTAAPRFTLDANRIAALQKDTEAVNALLSNIFQEEPPMPAVAEVAAELDHPAAGLLGLDEQHSAFARLLLTRVEWRREELDDAAADLDLMIDGALETLNEAAFDKHDIPFVDGDNPVVVNPELLEKLEA